MKLVRTFVLIGCLVFGDNVVSAKTLNKNHQADYKNFGFIVSGPSGVGKTTVINGFVAKNKNVNVAISTTTRSKRGNEVNGRDYFRIRRVGGHKNGKPVTKAFYGRSKSEAEDKYDKYIQTLRSRSD